MSIHSEHPFEAPPELRDPIRRLRGRLVLPVTVWTAERDGRPVGWTVSSVLVAEGDPAELLGLLDLESELSEALTEGSPVAVSLLDWSHRGLAEAFAQQTPAPGGPFRLGSWESTPWGPVLAGAPAWLGARVAGPAATAGWSRLVRGPIERVAVGAEPATELLAHLRGRYRAVTADGANEIR